MYGDLISQLKEKGKFDTKKFKILLWRNMLITLPLLRFRDPIKCQNKVESIRHNQRLIYWIFGLLELALFKAVTDDKEYEKLSEYNMSLLTCKRRSYVDSIFKDYSSIFFDCFSDFSLQPEVITLIKKNLGKEKAEKYDRVIKYELGVSEVKEHFGSKDYEDDQFETWVKCLENSGCEYFTDYVKKHFENDFILKDLDIEALKKRIVIFLAIGYSNQFKSPTPFAEIISIIELSESLNFTADEVGKLVKYGRKNRWSLAVIQEQMKFFKEKSRMGIDAYIRGGDLSFVIHKTTQIFKILFTDLVEEPGVLSRGKGDYKIQKTPKELLNSFERYNTQTNEIVHFTSLWKLKEILGTNTFRLYNAHNSNDKTEFSNWLDNFDIDADKLKRKTYIGSFCDSKILNDDEKASIMWDEYGKKGKGVVIKFEIAPDINAKTFEGNSNGEVTDFF